MYSNFEFYIYEGRYFNYVLFSNLYFFIIFLRTLIIFQTKFFGQNKFENFLLTFILSYFFKSKLCSSRRKFLSTLLYLPFSHNSIIQLFRLECAKL